MSRSRAPTPKSERQPRIAGPTHEAKTDTSSLRALLKEVREEREAAAKAAQVKEPLRLVVAG